jgi:hypothetical protein
MKGRDNLGDRAIREEDVIKVDGKSSVEVKNMFTCLRIRLKKAGF